MRSRWHLFFCLLGFVALSLPVDDTCAPECVTSPVDIRALVETVMCTVWDKVKAVYNDIYDSITVVKRIKSSLPVQEPLLYPIQNGDLAVVRRLVCQRNADVNRRLINTNQLPVERAAQHGHLHVVKFLVEHGASIDFPEKRFTPLHAAASRGHIHVMKYLVSLGAQIDSEDEYGVTPLHHAAYRGGLIAVAYLWALYLERLDDVQRFLLGREKKHVDDSFDTVLDWGVLGGNLAVVQFFVQQGAALDGRSYSLHIACLYSQTTMVRYLVHLGIDVKRKASVGLFWRHESVTPLQAVFSYPKKKRCAWDPIDLFDVIEMLVERGADVNEQWRSGTTILHRVCHMRGMHKVVNYLLKKGADLNALNMKGRAPLHYAAHSAQIIRFLVEHGANVNVCDSDGDTPLHDAAHYAFRRAARRDSFDALVALIQYGADASKENNAGMTPLLCLLFNRNKACERCVRYLLRWGVALNADEQRRLAEREQTLNFPEGTYTSLIDETREKVAQCYLRMERILLSNERDRSIDDESNGGEIEYTSILPDDLQRLLISFVVSGICSN